MEIVFKTARMKKECEDYGGLSRRYGRPQADKVIVRINELYSAESLHDIWKLPQARLHALSGNFKGCYAIDLKQPYRMIISPQNGDMANLKTVTKIQINNPCCNYH